MCVCRKDGREAQLETVALNDDDKDAFNLSPYSFNRRQSRYHARRLHGGRSPDAIVVNDSEIAYTTIGKFCSIAAMTRNQSGQSSDVPREPIAFHLSRKPVFSEGSGRGGVFCLVAGAIATKDVPAYAIVGGNPARLIRLCLPPSIAERLQKLAWWNWNHARLRTARPDFRNLPIDAFFDNYELVVGTA
jgi:hypothetical protein